MKLYVPTSEMNICKIDGVDFSKHRTAYLQNTYNMDFQSYVIKYYLNGIAPLCNCGCGTELSIKYMNDYIQTAEYTKNHAPKKKHTDEIKNKIKINTKKAIVDKYGVDNVFRLDSFKEKI